MVNLGLIGVGVSGIITGFLFLITFSNWIKIIGLIILLVGFLAILLGFASNGSIQGTRRG